MKVDNRLNYDFEHPWGSESLTETALPRTLKGIRVTRSRLDRDPQKTGWAPLPLRPIPQPEPLPRPDADALRQGSGRPLRPVLQTAQVLGGRYPGGILAKREAPHNRYPRVKDNETRLCGWI